MEVFIWNKNFIYLNHIYFFVQYKILVLNWIYISKKKHLFENMITVLIFNVE